MQATTQRLERDSNLAEDASRTENMVTTAYLKDDERWHALDARDINALGMFLYGVVTTGVVCHPGCGSRQPKRENVVFFDTLTAAREAGFRPCKRCGISQSPTDTRQRNLVAVRARLFSSQFGGCTKTRRTRSDSGAEPVVLPTPVQAFGRRNPQTICNEPPCAEIS